MKKLCDAKTRSRGRCRRQPMANGRCLMHGGKTPGGPASPHFVHGRRSQVLKDLKHFDVHYQRALADPDLLQLSADIAFTDARISELLARAGKEKADPRRALDESWPQIEGLIEQRRKLVDTESKRLKDLHAMVSVDRVMALVAYMTDAVRRHVKDPKVLTDILNDLRKVLKPEGV